MPRLKGQTVLGENPVHASAMIPAHLHEALRKRLFKERLTYSQWVRTQTERYLQDGAKR